MESKRTHFKMYKIGRKWAFACAVLLTLGGASVTVQADANADSSNSNVEANDASSTSESSTVTLKSTATTQKQAATTDDNATSESKDASQSSNEQADSQSNQSSQSSQTDVKDDQSSQTPATSADTTKVTADKTDTTNQNQAKTAQTDTAKTAESTKTDVQTPAKTTSTTDTQDQTADASDAAQKVQTTSIDLGSTASDFGTFKSNAKVTAAVNDAVQDGGSVYDDYADLHNILGISSQFHIFANEAELNAHTNGNIAVGNLIGNVNFGTNIIEELLDKDISYIQNITNIANSSFVSNGDTRVNKVIFGEGIEIDVSNPNRPMVNGTYIDHLLAEEVYQDKAGNVYIDFEKEFAQLKKTNAALAVKDSNVSYTNSDFTDMNNRVIDVSDLEPDENGQIVINLSADVLAGNTPLTIKGLSSDKDGNTIIINVDTEGQADYNVNSQIKVVYDDGSDRNNHETEDFGDNHLLWNFFDSTASDKQYAGTINVNAAFQGSVLAPSAEVIANQNLDGNIIANKVVVKAETHRWDLQDNKDNENDPKEPDPDPEFPDEPGETEEPEVPEVPTEPEEPETPTTEEPETPTDPEEPEEPTTEEPETPTDVDEPEDSEDPNTAVPDEQTPDEEEHLYSEDYDQAVEESFEDKFDEALALPADEQAAAEEALLSQLDAAIAQAKANGDQALVAKLEALRARVVAALKGKGLPQTDETQNRTASMLGLVLASALTLGGFAARRQRRH
ncbi:collagen-binding domain-containing protein [Lactiplantibacillus mudanjiangensis]|uniref:collagen-binding domain-containing protein n=1 Tax=Lactiplantibacillus mudanjiangensis TaxID=1296538 RepID=UPI00102F5997|nr:collagen-binding domain-containing protein [Lactiplantibacillus mudanjiangensis]